MLQDFQQMRGNLDGVKKDLITISLHRIVCVESCFSLLMPVCVFGCFGSVPVFLHMMFSLPSSLSSMSGRKSVVHCHDRYSFFFCLATFVSSVLMQVIEFAVF
jgi:hypothetical protein